MFATTAVVLTIGIARLIEGRTQDVNLVALSGAILITLGVMADRFAGMGALEALRRFGGGGRNSLSDDRQPTSAPSSKPSAFASGGPPAGVLRGMISQRRWSTGT